MHSSHIHLKLFSKYVFGFILLLERSVLMFLEKKANERSLYKNGEKYVKKNKELKEKFI